ncbi:hypothetical protein E4U55_005416 [Claviceps digitariae]|nr:hypothetical protein E4U55_005416 [Claviceps digitariae]
MATSLQFPRIYLLTTHLAVEEYSQLRNSLSFLEEDIDKAEIFVGKIAKGKRAEFELRRRNLDIKSLDQGLGVDEDSRGELVQASGNTASPSEIPRGKDSGNQKASESNDTIGLIRVVKLSWLTDSLAQQRVLPYDKYLLFQGIKLGKEDHLWHEDSIDQGQSPSTLLQRHRGDEGLSFPNDFSHIATRRGARKGVSLLNVPLLLQRTTSQDEDTVVNTRIPDSLRSPYSCQRSTPMNPPNREFIQELRRIRTLRLLQGDKIGVRAYSTSIATLSAYPYTIQNPAGWRDLNDIAEHGWQSLSRVQQIGLKYYSDFQKKISRQEVQDIAELILVHARRIDPGFEMVIVGGYRRGKKENGDVDVVLSHREEARTLNMVTKLVLSLESAGLITHTLSIYTSNSERGQQPLPWRGQVSGHASGFDTLDKAMVVWQNKQHSVAALHRRVDIIVSPWKTVGCALIGWSGGNTFQRDLRQYCKQQRGLKFDSSGIRRRSDGKWIDFEGSRAAREHVAVERDDRSAAPDMDIAEKRVFDGLDLKWLPATERCTG